MSPEFSVVFSNISKGIVSDKPMLVLDCQDYDTWNKFLVVYCSTNQQNMEMSLDNGIEITFCMDKFVDSAEEKFRYSFNEASSLLLSFLHILNNGDQDKDKPLQMASYILQLTSEEEGFGYSEKMEIKTSKDALLMNLFAKPKLFRWLGDYYQYSNKKP